MYKNDIKSGNQIQVQDANGNPVVPKLGANGGILMEMATEGAGSTGEATTLVANYITVGTTATQVPVSASKISTISIANYSTEAQVTVVAGTLSSVIGPNVAIDIPVNKTGISSISFTASAADTKVQYLVKGVEADD